MICNQMYDAHDGTFLGTVCEVRMRGGEQEFVTDYGIPIKEHEFDLRLVCIGNRFHPAVPQTKT